jgi:hypothetical protein
MQNHLIVGLGGTGGKIIRAFRKSLMEQYQTLTPRGVQLGYLYLDSDEEGMGPTDRRWRVLGNNVQLPKSMQLAIGTADLQPVLGNLNAFPGVKPWIGDRQFWTGVLSTQAGTTVLGGQKRRLGRFLFSQRAADFLKQIRTIANKLQSDSGETGVTFHVVCGLAGGTGSGSVVDVLAQLRGTYDDAFNFPIFAYTLLPDRNPPNGWDTGNYHANGYAALLELNAMHVGAFRPHDVVGQAGERRLESRDPFNLCYVFSNENENHSFLNVDSEVPDVIASFLSAAILLAHRENLSDVTRVLTAENLSEQVTPEPAPDGTGKERSRKFGVFGIKRLAYPEEEIRDYLTYAFARQAALQLAANHWVDNVGFTEEPKPQDFTEYVRKPEVQARWKYSLEHLSLSLGILDAEAADPRWKPIIQFWATNAPLWFQAVTSNTAAREQWMPHLKTRFEEVFQSGYRTQGVPEFYRGKLRARKEHAEQIARTVDRELFDGWLNGERSLADAAKLLSAFLAELKSIQERVERAATDDRAKVESADARIKANDFEWGKVGVAGRLVGKDMQILKVQTTVLQEKYTAMTRLHGWDFAHALVVELAARLEDLSNEVNVARKTIDEARARCTTEMNARCVQTTDYDLNKIVVSFYSTTAVSDLTTAFERNEDEQRNQTRAVRVAIKEKVAAGEQVTFAKFNERLRLDTVVEVLEQSCQASVDVAHANALAEGHGRERLLGVNIVEKLYDQFAGRPDELTEFVHDLMAKAGRYGSLDKGEMNFTGRNISTGEPPTSFAVLIPLAPDRKEFRAKLVQLFQGATGRAAVRVFESSRKNEITMLSVAAGFPLRFLADTRFLRDRYQRRLASHERSRIEVHLEGDGAQHPNLYLPSAEEGGKQMLELLLIAEALKLVESRRRGSAAKTRLVQILYDQDGDEMDAVDLGADLFDAVEQAPLHVVAGLKNAVEERLRARELRSEEARATLRKQISERVRVIKDELDEHDADLRERLTAALQGAKSRILVTAEA